MTYEEIQKLDKNSLLNKIKNLGINFSLVNSRMDNLSKYHFKELIRIYGQHLKRLVNN